MLFLFENDIHKCHSWLMVTISISLTGFIIIGSFSALCDGSSIFTKQFMSKADKEISVKSIQSNIERSIVRLGEPT